MRSWRRRGNERGFTFVELMTVLVILGLLAAIIFPRFMRARFKAYHNACLQSTKNIATALESYSIDNDHQYPANLNLLTLPVSGVAYISSLPTCASAPGAQYQTGYVVSPDSKVFTISCPGIHYAQLPGEIRQYFPQYRNNGEMIDR